MNQNTKIQRSLLNELELVISKLKATLKEEKTKTRYFVAPYPRGWSLTKYIRMGAGGVVLVSKDGEEDRLDYWTPEKVEDYLKAGHCKEVSKKQALNWKAS